MRSVGGSPPTVGRSAADLYAGELNTLYLGAAVAAVIAALTAFLYFGRTNNGDG